MSIDLEINFCDDCNNLTYLHLNDSNELIHYCKLCDKQKKINNPDKSIYTQYFSEIDNSQVINANKYINQDITLPTIEGNTSIQCVNTECISIKDQLPSSIKYMKYHFDDMKYIYICNHCGQKWNNK